MIKFNKEIIDNLDMIQLRKLYRGICEDKLKSWIGIDEAKEIIYKKLEV